MRKIGFIDRHLNNFHANHYLKLIREGRFRGEFDVVLAYGDEEQGGVDSVAWGRDNHVPVAESIEQVVDVCDSLIILSPDNPERHRDLCDYPLRSGKPCYVDKTFAPSFAIAHELIGLAAQHSTPMFTTSALRFVPELQDFLAAVGRERRTKAAAASGPGHPSNYAVHCVEPLVMLLGHGATGVTYSGDGDFNHFSLDYDDGRMGQFTQYHAAGEVGGKWYGHPFAASVLFEGGSTALAFTCDEMFDELVASICRFFLGESPPAPLEDTLEVMAILEGSGTAMKSPGARIDIGALKRSSGAAAGSARRK